MEQSIKNIQVILIIFLFFAVIYILSFLSSILIPLVLAFLIATIFQPLIQKLKTKKIPNWIILPTISIITLGIVFLIAFIISNTISEINNQFDYLVDRFRLKAQNSLIFINDLLDLDVDSKYVVNEIEKNFDAGWLGEQLGNLALSLGSFLGSFLMFALYYVLILAGMSEYKNYLKYVGGAKGKLFIKEYDNIQKSIYSYMTIKTLISIITGLLVYTGCVIFGIKFAVFWGFLAYLLNYIPSIGSIMGTVFPILMGIIEIDSIQALLLFALTLSSVQFVMGNVIEPILMGNRLRLNTLTVIFGLVFWGFIWGIPGMILSVPLLVILKIIFEHFDSFAIFARIMGYPEKKRFADRIKKSTT